MEPTHFESLYPANTREKEIAEILTFIKQGNSCQLISIPGTGRSNLLGLLPYNKGVREKHLGENQKWFHFVLCDFSEVKGRTLFDVTKFLFLSLADSLRDRKLDQEHAKLHEIFKEHLQFQDELVLFQGLKEAVDFLAIEKELTIVFLFDRFEEYIPTVTSEFFANLRILRNKAKYRFSVVFSQNRTLEDTVEPSLLADFFEFVQEHHVYLSLFDEPSVLFRISYIEKLRGKTLGKKQLDQIMEQTAGHAKLTRLCAETLLATSLQLASRRSGQQAISNQNLSELLISQNAIQKALLEIWQSLTPSEQNTLHNVILSVSEGSLDSSSHLRRTQNDTRPGEINEYLEKIGLLKDGKITILLFMQFVQNQKQNTVNQHISFNQNTNDIVKGSQNISDSLTAAEFRLLKFLIANTDRIIDREEIIKTVWKDAQSTAGVTDQALDQLIFRVRKKIEDDPNNPAHLQTVKGRGFRFTP